MSLNADQVILDAAHGTGQFASLSALEAEEPMPDLSAKPAQPVKLRPLKTAGSLPDAPVDSAAATPDAPALPNASLEQTGEAKTEEEPVPTETPRAAEPAAEVPPPKPEKEDKPWRDFLALDPLIPAVPMTTREEQQAVKKAKEKVSKMDQAAAGTAPPKKQRAPRKRPAAAVAVEPAPAEEVGVLSSDEDQVEPDCKKDLDKTFEEAAEPSVEHPVETKPARSKRGRAPKENEEKSKPKKQKAGQEEPDKRERWEAKDWQGHQGWQDQPAQAQD